MSTVRGVRWLLSIARSGSALSLRSDAPDFILEGLHLAFSRRQQLSIRRIQCSIISLLTLCIVLDLYALQLEPAPVDDLVCEDGNEGVFQDRSAPVLVEVALCIVSIARTFLSAEQP